MRSIPSLRRPHLQGLNHLPAREHQLSHLTFAIGLHLKPSRKGIGHTHPDAMQATRKAIGPTLSLVELSSRMQAGKHQFDHRGFFIGMKTKRNASALVLDAHRTVCVNGDPDLASMPGQSLISGVIDHLLHDMQRVVGAGVHARALLDGLQALENTDRAF